MKRFLVRWETMLRAAWAARRSRRASPRWLPAAALAWMSAVCAVTPAGAAMVVTQCGERVPDGETAYLAADLDCRESTTAGVVLGHRGRLILAGFAIVGEPSRYGENGEPLQGVRCEAHTVCTVEGPGAIVGFSGAGVAGTRVRVRDVVVAGNARAGIAAFENVRVVDAQLQDNGALDVHAGGRIRVAGSARRENRDALALVEWRAPKITPLRARDPR